MQQLDAMSGEVLLKAYGGASLTVGSCAQPWCSAAPRSREQHRADQAECLTRVITPALAAPSCSRSRWRSLALPDAGAQARQTIVSEPERSLATRRQRAARRRTGSGCRRPAESVLAARSLPSLSYRPVRSWPATGPRSHSTTSCRCPAHSVSLRDTDPQSAVGTGDHPRTRPPSVIAFMTWRKSARPRHRMPASANAFVRPAPGRGDRRDRDVADAIVSSATGGRSMQSSATRSDGDRIRSGSRLASAMELRDAVAFASKRRGESATMLDRRSTTFRCPTDRATLLGRQVPGAPPRSSAPRAPAVEGKGIAAGTGSTLQLLEHTAGGVGSGREIESTK